MKEIQLTRGYVALVDDADYERLNQWSWHAIIWSSGVPYARTSMLVDCGIGITKSRKVRMSRFIMGAPDDLEVDHKNGNTLDNQRHNLRLATHQQNRRNSRMRRDKTSIYHGVSWNKKDRKWVAQIGLSGIVTYLGSFNSEHDAAIAYNAAAIREDPEFFPLNFL